MVRWVDSISPHVKSLNVIEKGQTKVTPNGGKKALYSTLPQILFLSPYSNPQQFILFVQPLFMCYTWPYMRGPEFNFNPGVMQNLVGGLPTMDLSTLNIHRLEQAHNYIRSYGYDVNDEGDLKKLWGYHQRSVTFIQSELLLQEEKIPSGLTNPDQVGDIGHLLIYASTRDSRSGSLRSWACAILKVMHVLVHLDNDLFHVFSKEIQEQILKSIQSHIYNDPGTRTQLG